MPGVFEQIKLVAGLRWLTLKNGLRRKNTRWDLVGMVWVAVFSGLLVVGLGFAFYAGGYEFIARGQAAWMALLYWAIFVWWQVFPLFVAGFGSNFEFRTLLRFPLSLRAFYLMGLGYGLADFGAVSSILWILSMMAGAASAPAGVLPAMGLVSALFVLVNVTIERLVGSWLEKILAKRRSREVFLGLFILSMVSLNFLSPLLQRYGQAARPRILEMLPYVSWLPGSLAGDAVGAAAAGNHRAVLSAAAGLLVWLVVTSGLFWQRFEVLYRGEETSEAPAPKAVKKREKRQASTGELPRFISPQVVSVAVKEFRYLTRNGFAFLTLVIPPIMVMFFTMQFGPKSMLKEHALKPELFFPGMMAYLILILISPAYNAFAYEGKGIQAYFMAPVRFQDVLLGKNLFLVGLVVFELVLALALLTWRGRGAGGAAFRGHDHGRRVRGRGTTDDCKLVIVELPEKNGNWKDEGAKKFRRVGVDGIWRTDCAWSHMRADLDGRQVVWQRLDTRDCVCGADRGGGGGICSVVASDESPGGRKERIADRNVVPVGGLKSP